VATYGYPTAAQLQAIEQEVMPTLLLEDPIFQDFPIVTVDENALEWEQRDNYIGLQQVRGMNGEPPRVGRIGAKRYLAPVGVYGEHIPIDEREITARRVLGTFDRLIDLTQIVAETQEQLLHRRIMRVRQIIWTLLSTGTFSVANGQGVVMHTDSYTMQTFSAAVAWATIATATPLSDFRAVKLLARGHGVDLGRRAKAYMNAATANALMKNTNASDLGGRRMAGGATFNSLADNNSIFLENDLPQVVVLDDGYYDESSTFQLFVPNNKVVVVGQRPMGSRLGEYRMTRNANNPGAAPGPYTTVVDEQDPPKKLEVHDGHNGGPVIFFPSAVVVMTV
jgi:hypothetical protein